MRQTMMTTTKLTRAARWWGCFLRAVLLYSIAVPCCWVSTAWWHLARRWARY